MVKSEQGWLLWETCCLTCTCLFDATQHCTTCGLRSRRRPRRRIVPARAAAYGRVTESIDLIAAYPQVVLGGNINQGLHHNTRLLETRDAPGRESIVRQTVTSSVRVQRCCVRFRQSWSRFHHEFRWLVDHEPMAHGFRSSGIACVVAHAGAIKRAVKAREYVVSEERAGRNVLVRAAETFSAEPWREEWWKTAESETDALAHAKSVLGRSSRCATITTYVDDCDLHAAKPLRTRLCEHPVHKQKILGVVREAWDSISSCRGLRLTQGDYTAKTLEDAVKLGFGPIRVCTTAGQSVTPPDPKSLPEQPCDLVARELIGSLLFLSRCTRFDISFVIARLARFVTRRCGWARKEIRHILGFVAHTAEWSPIMKSAGDD